MNEVILTLGTTSEIVQKVVEHANTKIVTNWIAFGFALGAAILATIYFIVFIEIRDVIGSVTFGIVTICLILMAIFCFCNVSLWEQRIEAFSQNPDEAVEYYIDNMWRCHMINFDFIPADVAVHD